MQQQQWNWTSGSLSPSSSNSIVGLKPTTGLLSRSGIVPLSAQIPQANDKKVIDSAILVSVMCW
jgi:amidase